MDTFLFRAVAVEYEAASGATLALATDLPSPFATRETVSLTATTGSRRAIARNFALAGTTKGRLIDVNVTAPAGGTVVVQRIRFFVRKLGREATNWMWYELPLPRSASDEWITIKVPVPSSPDEMSTLRVPVPESAADLATIRVPVPPTPDEMATVRVPVPPSPDEMITVPVAVPPCPEQQHIHDLPMDE